MIAKGESPPSPDFSSPMSTVDFDTGLGELDVVLQSARLRSSTVNVFLRITGFTAASFYSRQGRTQASVRRVPHRQTMVLQGPVVVVVVL
jgi:hypothetical protein